MFDAQERSDIAFWLAAMSATWRVPLVEKIVNVALTAPVLALTPVLFTAFAEAALHRWPEFRATPTLAAVAAVSLVISEGYLVQASRSQWTISTTAIELRAPWPAPSWTIPSDEILRLRIAIAHGGCVLVVEPMRENPHRIRLPGDLLRKLATELDGRDP